MGGLTGLEAYSQERRNTLSSGEDTRRLKIITTSGRKISTYAPAKSPKMILEDGYHMPAFGLGTCHLSTKKGEVTRAVCDAIDAGYRHFDCAWSHMNETEVGAAIKLKIEEGVVKRKDLFIVSKLWNTFHRRDLVKVGLQQSLDRLGVGYLDLFLIQWPTAFKGTGSPTDLCARDENGNIVYADVDICDTWNAMEMLVKKGLVKSIGVSNFNSKQLERILETCDIRPAVVQLEVHPYFNNRKLVEFCQRRNIQVTAYGPLSAPHQIKEGEPNLLEDPVLVEIAQHYGKSVAQVILRWVLQRNISLVPKSVNKQRLAENFDIFDFHLSEEHMRQIFGLNRNFRTNIFIEQAGGHREYPFSIKF